MNNSKKINIEEDVQEEERTTKLCPKCGSENLSFDFMSLAEFSTGNSSMNCYCLDCGYGKFLTNAIFVDVKNSEVEEFKEKIKLK